MSRKLAKSFLDSYKDYMSESETPRAFSLWCGISAISSALKRKVFINHGHYKIYASNYIVLVSPPGIGKGAAINPAIDLIKKAGTANIIEGRITTEKLIDKLSNGFFSTFKSVTTNITSAVKDTSATVAATELPIFLGASDWILPCLCELWDRNEFVYDTKNKGTSTVKDVNVGLLGGCVPEFIRKINKDATTSVTGGFTSRCIFIYADKKFRKIPWPNQAVANKLEDDLVEDLREIAQISGEFTFTADARNAWTDYYINKLVNVPFEPEVVANFKARMPAHIFKCAMAFTVSETDTLVINRTNLFNAIQLVEDVKNNLGKTFRGVGESPLAASKDRIETYLERRSSATFNDITKHNSQHVREKDLEEVLRSLVRSGFCKVLPTTTGNEDDRTYIYLKPPTIIQSKGIVIP